MLRQKESFYYSYFQRQKDTICNIDWRHDVTTLNITALLQVYIYKCRFPQKQMYLVTFGLTSVCSMWIAHLRHPRSLAVRYISDSDPHISPHALYHKVSGEDHNPSFRAHDPEMVQAVRRNIPGKTFRIN